MFPTYRLSVNCILVCFQVSRGKSDSEARGENHVGGQCASHDSIPFDASNRQFIKTDHRVKSAVFSGRISNAATPGLWHDFEGFDMRQSMVMLLGTTIVLGSMAGIAISNSRLQSILTEASKWDYPILFFFPRRYQPARYRLFPFRC